MKRILVIGTGNPHKMGELAPVLLETGLPLELLAASHYGKFDPDETGATLEENALIKARAALELSREWSIADDTGLFVDALNGRPGIYAARYAGPGCSFDDNVRKMLGELEGVADSSRGATFSCVIALCRPGAAPEVFRGDCRGHIVAQRRGGGGFGYDPIFVPDGFNVTFAELPAEQKNRISHRSIAAHLCRERLAELLTKDADNEQRTPKKMRIISLLPSATEIVYALGLQDHLVGITHECDYPPEARQKPALIECCLGAEPEKMSAGEIDRRVCEATASGAGVYRFKPGALEQAAPDLVLTQGLCDVCALPYQLVMQEIKKLPKQPFVMSLDPQDLAGILVEIRRVGELCCKIERAGEVVGALEERIGAVAERSSAIPPENRPRVAVIEWTDPLYAAGHWVPEMVEYAGGRDALGKPGEPSRTFEWNELAAAQPEVIVVAICGYDIPRSLKEIPSLQARPGWAELPAVKSGRVYCVDANATLSRPGPRIVDGLEALAEIIQPRHFAPQRTALWNRA